jgi:transposase-like protein
MRFVRAVRAVDPSHPAAELARLCVEHEIPVSTVAAEFGVTRASVYGWFSGARRPREELMQPIRAYTEKLKQLSESA